MSDVEKQLREIMQQNDPREVEKSVAIAEQLSQQYEQIRNKKFPSQNSQIKIINSA